MRAGGVERWRAAPPTVWLLCLQARGGGPSVAGGGLAAGGTDAGDGAAAGADSDEAAATSGGADSTATADTTAAAAAATSTGAEHEEAGCSHSCADDASGGKVSECGEEEGVPGVCHDVVQEVLDRILQQ